MTISLQKTLSYNLILFNFILLEASTTKISNFFIEKLVLKNNILKKVQYRIELFGLLVAFKRFIRSFFFVKKKKNLLTIFCNDFNLELVKLLFQKYSINCFLDLSLSKKIKQSTFLKSLLFLEYPVQKAKIFAFFMRNNYLIHTVNTYDNDLSFSQYKIFSTLSDQKKLIFLCLILISIFKI